MIPLGLASIGLALGGVVVEVFIILLAYWSCWIVWCVCLICNRAGAMKVEPCVNAEGKREWEEFPFREDHIHVNIVRC